MMLSYFKYILEILAHLFFLSCILLSSGGTGYFFIRKSRFHSTLEKLIFSTSLGLGIWALLLFALAQVGWLHRHLVLILTLACTLVVVLNILRSHHFEFPFSKPRSKHLIVVAAILYLGLLLLPTFYPPNAWDSTMYHLPLARQFLFDGHISVNTGLVFPILPLLNHMLFSWALALKGHLLAQMIEWIFLVLTAFGLYSWGLREGRAAFGVAVSAFWLAHPLVLWLGRSAYVDVGVTAFFFLGIYALYVFWNQNESHWWFIGIVLLSFAAGVKMSALPMLMIGVLLGFIALLKSKINWKSLVIGYGLAAVSVAPWYALIFYHTGNPFWPLFYQHSRGIWAASSISEFQYIFNVGIPKNLLNFFLLPFYLAVHPELFHPDDNQPLLFAIIAWPLGWVLSFFSRSVRWWTFWTTAYTALWFLSSQQLRFWIMILPAAALVIFESIRWLIEKFIKSSILQNGIWISLMCVSLFFGAKVTLSLLNVWSFPSVTEERQQKFLLDNFISYKALDYVNSHSKRDDAIYVINGSWLNYHFKPKVIDMNGILQGSTRPVFHWPEDKRWIENLKSQNVAWIFISHLHLPESLNLKNRSSDYPGWPEYRLVYSDSQSWVYHYEFDQGNDR